MSETKECVEACFQKRIGEREKDFYYNEDRLAIKKID